MSRRLCDGYKESKIFPLLLVFIVQHDRDQANSWMYETHGNYSTLRLLKAFFAFIKTIITN